MVENVPFELRQVFVDMGTMVVIGHSFIDREQVVVRKSLLFRNVGNHVLPEAVNPQIQPEAHDVLDFLPHLRIIHIQIGLLHRKEMEIIFAANLIVSPRLALKIGVPVVGQLPVLPCRTPDVVVRIGVNTAAALLEPFMLIAGVVHHQIHDHLHAPGMGALQHFFKGFHTAEFRGNIPVIGNIVAAVRSRGGVDG